jgi:hypothetical protein
MLPRIRTPPKRVPRANYSKESLRMIWMGILNLGWEVSHLVIVHTLETDGWRDQRDR